MQNVVINLLLTPLSSLKLLYTPHALQYFGENEHAINIMTDQKMDTIYFLDS